MSMRVSYVSLRYLKLLKIDFPSKLEMMNDITKKYFHQLLDGLHLVLVVDVREGVQHVPYELIII